ncbi:MAG: HU family DNA-binding protein [Breznakibacter sp.]
MALFYKTVQRSSNPGNPEAPKRWYLILKSLGMMKEKDVAAAIADETTLNPKEAEMAIYQFQKVLAKYLLEGHTVQLGELGSFQLVAQSDGVDNESDVTPTLVKKINIRFTPSTAIKEAIAKASFKPVKGL